MIVNTEETNPHSTAMIVSSYVRHHMLRPEQLSDLIEVDPENETAG